MRALTAVLAGILLGLPSVPYAVAIGLHPLAAIFFSALGMCVGMTGVAFVSDRWIARSKAKAAIKGKTSKLASLADRAQPMVDRVGIAGLGFVGLIVFGTSSSAVIGTALGVPRWKLLPWLYVGAFFWAVVINYGIDLLLSFFRS